MTPPLGHKHSKSGPQWGFCGGSVETGRKGGRDRKRDRDTCTTLLTDLLPFEIYPSRVLQDGAWGNTDVLKIRRCTRTGTGGDALDISDPHSVDLGARAECKRQTCVVADVRRVLQRVGQHDGHLVQRPVDHNLVLAK